jgi:alpha-tubulin suppressor-like RCC1 family protein
MGSNDYGQLGNGMRTTRGAPAPVTMATGITSIAAGGGFTCGITMTGDVMCWGQGDDGELADGSFDDRAAVGATLGLSNIAQLALGGDFGCARESGGRVLCWGYNGQGQLGLGNQFGSAVPRPVTLPGAATDIAAGNDQACALVGGTAYCWGDNDEGQLGRGTKTNFETTPAAVSTLTGAKNISCAEETCCAITAANGVQCWGNNQSGQLGNASSPTDSTTPVDVIGVSNVMSLSARAGRTFALLANGTVMGWGYNCDGRLGTMPGNCGANGTPLMLASLSNVTKVAAGYEASCALRSDSSVVCWGPGWNGQIGDGAYTTRTTATPVGLTGVIDIASGGGHACALMMDKSVQCWGQDDAGQLGDGAHWTAVPTGARLVCE